MEVIVDEYIDEEEFHNKPNTQITRKDSNDVTNLQTISFIEQEYDNNDFKNMHYQSVQIDHVNHSNLLQQQPESLRIMRNNEQFRRSKLLQIYLDENLYQDKETETANKKDIVQNNQILKNMNNLKPGDDKWNQAAIEIFNSIFEEVFKVAEQKLCQFDPESGNVFITKEQFEQATQQVDEIERLLELFSHADHNQNGKIFKNDLVQVLKLDLITIYNAIQVTDAKQFNSFNLENQSIREIGSLIFQTTGSPGDIQESPNDDIQINNQDNNFFENKYKLKKKRKDKNQTLMHTERGRINKINEEFQIEQKENIRLKDFTDSAKKLEKVYENADVELQKYKAEIQQNTIKQNPLKLSSKKGNSKSQIFDQTNDSADNQEANKNTNNKQSATNRSQSWKRKSHQQSYEHLLEQTLQTQFQTIKIININNDEAYTKIEEAQPELKVIEEQANTILNEIFSLYFDSQDQITFTQYEQAINSYFVSLDDIQRLKDLFSKADSNLSKKVSKQKLLHAFKEDLVRFQKNQRKSQITNSCVSEEQQNQINEFNNQIQNHIRQLSEVQIDPREDPVLNLLSKTIKEQPDNLNQQIQNLTQTIEYIKLYKLDDYNGQLGHLKYLFNILYDSSLSVQSQVECLNKNNSFKDSNIRASIIKDNRNSETNQSLEQLQYENEKIKREVDRLYQIENLYHNQAATLNLYLSEKNELENEKENIKQINQELLTEYEQKNQQNEQLILKYKRELQESQSLRVQIESLKKQVLQKFNVSESDEDNANINEDSFQEDYDVEEDSNHTSPNKNISFDNKIGSYNSNHKNQKNINNSMLGSNINQSMSLNMEKLNLDQQYINFINNNNVIKEQQTQKEEQKSQNFMKNQKYATDEEIQLIFDLETTEVFKMRDRIKSYLKNTIRLEREGKATQIKELKKKQNQLKQQNLEKEIKIQEQQRDLICQQNLCENMQNQLEEKEQLIDELRNQLIDQCQQKERLEQAKKRLMGANQLLEQKIRVEKSEKMSLISEVIHAEKFDDGKSMKSGRSQFSAISGLTSRYGGGRLTNFIHLKSQNSRQPNFTGNKVNHEQKSIRSETNQWLNQKYEYSQYKDKIDENSFDGLSTYSNQQKNRNHIDILNQTQDGFENKSSRYNNLQMLQYKEINSFVDQQSFQALSQTEQKFEQTKKVYKHYLSSSQKSLKQDGAQNNFCSRVQVISDFGSQSSDSQSIADQLEMDKINKSLEVIRQEEQQSTAKKDCNYDFLQIKNTNNPLHKLIQDFLDSQNKDKKSQIIKNQLQSKNLLSDQISIYNGKCLKDGILLIISEQIYLFIYENNSINLYSKPFSFLDSIDRIIFSERHPSYVVFQMMKSLQSTHIIFETNKNKEYIFEYMVDFSQECDDNIILEENEEFSIQFQSQEPIWFKFDDINQLKLQIQKQSILEHIEEFSGFLEIKNNNSLNIFKSLFQGQKVLWEKKFFVLRDIRVFIYSDQNQKNPEKIIRLSMNFQINEMRKADSQGKINVFTICPDITIPQNLQQNYFLSSNSSDNMIKWIQKLQNVKSIIPKYYNQKQPTQDLIIKQNIKVLDQNIKNVPNIQIDLKSPKFNQNIQQKNKDQTAFKMKKNLDTSSSILDVFGFEQMQKNDGGDLRLYNQQKQSNEENKSSKSNLSNQSYSVINDEQPFEQIQSQVMSNRSIDKARRGRASRAVNKKQISNDQSQSNISVATKKDSKNSHQLQNIFIKSPMKPKKEEIKDDRKLKSQLQIPILQKQRANLPHQSNLQPSVSLSFSAKNNISSLQARNIQLINLPNNSFCQKQSYPNLKKDDQRQVASQKLIQSGKKMSIDINSYPIQQQSLLSTTNKKKSVESIAQKQLIKK